MIDLDFSSVVPNQCLPDEYYAWVPTDEVTMVTDTVSTVMMMM